MLKSSSTDGDHDATFPTVVDAAGRNDDVVSDTPSCFGTNLADRNKVATNCDDSTSSYVASQPNANVKNEPVDSSNELLLDDELRMQIERSIEIVVNEFSLECEKNAARRSDGVVKGGNDRTDLLSTCDASNVAVEPRERSSPALLSSRNDDLCGVDGGISKNIPEATCSTFSSYISDSVTVTKVVNDVKKSNLIDGTPVKREPIECNVQIANKSVHPNVQEPICSIPELPPNVPLKNHLPADKLKPCHLIDDSKCGGLPSSRISEFSLTPSVTVKPILLSAKSTPARNASTGGACQATTKIYSKSPLAASATAVENRGTSSSYCVNSSVFDNVALLTDDDVNSVLLPSECCDGKAAVNNSSCYLSVNRSNGSSDCVFRKSSTAASAFAAAAAAPASSFVPYANDYFYRKPSAPSYPRVPVFGAAGATRTPHPTRNAIEFSSCRSAHAGSNLAASVESPVSAADRFKGGVSASTSHYYRSSASSSLSAYLPSKINNTPPVDGPLIYNPASDPLGRIRSANSILNPPSARSSSSSSLVNWNSPSCMFQSSSSQASFNFSLPHTARISSVSKLIRSDSSNSMSLYSADTTNVSIPSFNASYQMKSQNVTISKNAIFPRFPFRPPLPKSPYCFPSQIPCFNSNCCNDAQQQFSMV